MIISVTELSQYLFCPRSLYASMVLGKKEPANSAMILGGLKHAVMEQATVGEKATIQSMPKGMGKAELVGRFTSSYLRALELQIRLRERSLSEFAINEDEVRSQISPGLVEEAAKRGAFVHDFSTKTNTNGYELWELLYPKLFAEMSVQSRELRLKGRIDRVELFSDKCVVYELKTGKPPFSGIWPSHKIQAAAYSMLAETKFNGLHTEAVIKYSGDDLREVIMNPFLRDEVTSTTDRIIRMVESQIMPNQCKRETCPCHAL